MQCRSLLYTGCFFYDLTCLKCYKMTSFCPMFTIRSRIIPEVMWLQNYLVSYPLFIYLLHTTPIWNWSKTSFWQIKCYIHNALCWFFYVKISNGKLLKICEFAILSILKYSQFPNRVIHISIITNSFTRKTNVKLGIFSGRLAVKIKISYHRHFQESTDE